MNRRLFLTTSITVPVVASFERAFAVGRSGSSRRYAIRRRQCPAGGARTRAEAFLVPDTSLPDNIKNLDYDKYRKIRFIPNKALWRNDGLPFQIQFFHRGFYFSNRVDVFEVAEGRARPIKYSPSLFNFEYVPPPPPDADLGFAGFRVHAAPTISTRLECFSVPVISVRSPRGRPQ